jgi:hypothetical protein
MHTAMAHTPSPHTHQPHPGKLRAAGRRRRHARPRRTGTTPAHGRSFAATLDLRRGSCDAAALRERKLWHILLSRARCPASDKRMSQRQRVIPTRARASDSESRSVVCQDGVARCSRSTNWNEVPHTWYTPTSPFPSC